MRCYLIVAGTLLSMGVAFTQQTDSNPRKLNVVPQEAMNEAIYRALARPKPMAPLRAAPRIVRPGQSQIDLLMPKACAVPLLDARGKPTGDRMSRSVNKGTDPRIVVPPPVPACPKP